MKAPLGFQASGHCDSRDILVSDEQTRSSSPPHVVPMSHPWPQPCSLPTPKSCLPRAPRLLPTHLPALPAAPALSKAAGLGPLPGEAKGVSQGQAGSQLALPQPQRGGQRHLRRGQAEREASPQRGPPHHPAQVTSFIKVKGVRAAGPPLGEALWELQPIFQRSKLRLGEQQIGTSI